MGDNRIGMKEGIAARQSGASCPYPGNTIKHFLHCEGWLREDLRIALMKADPKYEASQAAFAQGLQPGLVGPADG